MAKLGLGPMHCHLSRKGIVRLRRPSILVNNHSHVPRPLSLTKHLKPPCTSSHYFLKHDPPIIGCTNLLHLPLQHMASLRQEVGIQVSGLCSLIGKRDTDLRPLHARGSSTASMGSVTGLARPTPIKRLSTAVRGTESFMLLL